MAQQRRPGRYPVEMRERAVRMVFEAERRCGSQWEAICSVAEKLSPTAETVRKWVRARRSMRAPGRGFQLMSVSGSGRWSGRTGSCGGRMRS